MLRLTAAAACLALVLLPVPALAQHGGHSSGGRSYSSHSYSSRSYSSRSYSSRSYAGRSYAGHSHGSHAYTSHSHGSHVHAYRPHTYRPPRPAATHSREHRSAAAKDAFLRSTGHPHGWPGHVVDHRVPLACGGADAPSNMQWQTTADAKAKDKWERRGCHR